MGVAIIEIIQLETNKLDFSILEYEKNNLFWTHKEWQQLLKWPISLNAPVSQHQI